ncbi:MAG: TRAP transporter small permease subunit [Gammaproteobacteria bacterium]|nr:TRAP transporter small permease subunit [Gammaproteobacteria bacterium]
MLPETAFSRAVDGALHRFDDWLAWIWMLLLGVIVLNVVMRYAFGEGRIEFEEIQWHLYATGMLLGLAACYVDDAHVRVDVLHERLSPRLRAWIELYGTLLLLLPFIALMLIYSVPFVAHSFSLSEVSVAPGGLPLRWLIKAMLPLGFLLLLIASIARLTRVWVFLFGPSARTHDAS